MTFNLLLALAMMLVTFSIILVGFKFFGLVGLYGFATLALVVANIFISTRVPMLGMSVLLGFVVFSSTFLTTDIINEIYGKKRAQTAVWLGFYGMLTFMVLSQIALAFKVVDGDVGQPAMNVLFSIMPRITFASLAAYLMSNTYDVWVYDFWRKKFPKQLWFRNNASTITSQLFDSIVFAMLGFFGAVPGAVLVSIMFGAYIFKVIAAAIDTPFVYAARWMSKNTKIGTMLPEKDRDADIASFII